MSDKEKRFTLTDIFKNIIKDTKKEKLAQEKENIGKKIEKKTLEEIFLNDCSLPNFDLVSFSFSFSGGPVHSEILAASAFYKEGIDMLRIDFIF